MSIDFFVYSPAPGACTRAELTDALARRGWTASFISPEGGLVVQAPGVVNDEVIVAARSARSAAAIRDALLRASQDHFDALWKQGEACSCGLSADAIDPEEAGGMTQEFRENYGDGVADRVSRAKTSYYVRTSMGRSDGDFELQAAVWESIGQITGGLMDDPQSGSLHEFQNGQLVSLTPSEE